MFARFPGGVRRRVPIVVAFYLFGSWGVFTVVYGHSIRRFLARLFLFYSGQYVGFGVGERVLGFLVRSKPSCFPEGSTVAASWEEGYGEVCSWVEVIDGGPVRSICGV